VRRFAAIWMLAVGLLVAGWANAANLGTFSVDCVAFQQQIVPLNPSAGDFFTVNITGTCGNSYYLVGSPITTPGNGSYAGSQVFTFTSNGSGEQFLVVDFGNVGTRFIFNAPLVAAPTVTSISPTSGSTAGGDTITITGTDLTGATGITVGGNACTAFNVASATSATCTTPAGTAGTASVVVTTPGGSNAANTLFTYVAVAAVPSLSEWAQLMLALMVIGIAWHFHNNRQNSY
jgi:hypothetical protein